MEVNRSSALPSPPVQARSSSVTSCAACPTVITASSGWPVNCIASRLLALFSVKDPRRTLGGDMHERFATHSTHIQNRGTHETPIDNVFPVLTHARYADAFIGA